MVLARVKENFTKLSALDVFFVLIKGDFLPNAAPFAMQKLFKKSPSEYKNFKLPRFEELYGPGGKKSGIVEMAFKIEKKSGNYNGIIYKSLPELLGNELLKEKILDGITLANAIISRYETSVRNCSSEKELRQIYNELEIELNNLRAVRKCEDWLGSEPVHPTQEAGREARFY